MMTSRRERRDVYCLAHGDVASVVGMEIIPRQLSELAVGQKLRLHVARSWVECSRVKIFYPVKESAGANEGVKDHSTGVMPRTVVAHVYATDTQRRGQCPSEDLNALSMQAADDVLIAGNDRISRVTGPDVIDAELMTSNCL
jgi:hypothetical protein